MTTSPRQALAATVAAVVVALGLAPDAAAGDDVQIQFLASTGADPNGTARARFRVDDDDADERDFSVELEQMDAGSYELLVGGVARGMITVGGTGEGEIEFQVPPDPPKPLFDFEVFGQTIEVRQDATVFFSDTFAPGGGGGGGGGGGSGGAGKSKLEVFMTNVGPDLNARGRLRHERKPGETRFDVNLEHLDAGAYDLRVGGAVVATFDTLGAREVELDFRDPPDDDPDEGLVGDELEIHFTLGFDPLGEQVDVAQADVVFLTAMLPADGSSSGTQPPKQGKGGATDLGKQQADRLRVMLQSTGVLFGAQGHVELEQDGDEREFEVEIEDVPDASYALCVGGVERGVLVVAGGEGRLDYSTQPEAGELLLDFAVKGELVEVKAGADVVLTVVFPTSVQEALGLFAKETHAANKIVVNLVNAGSDLDARGKLRWTAKASGREVLRLGALDLPPGEYAVRVDGVARGSLTVSPKGKGQLTFDSQASAGGAKVPLDFPVTGLLLEIADGGDEVVLHVIVE